MIKLIVHEEKEFEMPECCCKCPMHSSFQDGNARIDTCSLLKKEGDPWYSTISAYDYDIHGNRIPIKDERCPLKDEETVYLR